MVHSLNIDPGVKPVVQLTRAFHTNVEAQITQEATSSWFYQTHLAPQVAFQHSTHEKKKKEKEKNGQIWCCVYFRNLNKACLKEELPNAASL